MLDMDRLIKNVMIKSRKPLARGADCPGDNQLASYADDIMKGNLPDDAISEHLSSCDRCFSVVADAVHALRGFDEKSREESAAQPDLNRPRIVPQDPPKSRRKQNVVMRNKFLIVSGAFFVLSFIFKPYFIQLLAAAVIFGFKWVMDTGGSRALIMIYDSWQSAKHARGRHDIHSRL